MNKKNMIRNLSPWNDCDEMPTAMYIAKKMLAFFMLYAIAAVVGEGIIIGIVYALGYDPVHGIMPVGQLGQLLPYYGFVIFLLVALFYCKIVEKRDLKSIGFGKRVSDYFMGGIVAIVLLCSIIGVCCGIGAISYNGMKEDSDILYLMALGIGFIIQGAAEEVLCRGFLLQSLLRKTSVPMAVLVSSTAFTIPHLFTLFEADLQYAVIGVLNLYLISTIFSLQVLHRSNIWGCCGLHSVWNFILYGIFGLTLSGNAIGTEGVLCFEIHDANIVNGGVYGIEASIVTTIILLLVVMGFLRFRRERSQKDGI